jgi:hypothetical protein
MTIRQTIAKLNTHPFVARSSDELLQAIATDILIKENVKLYRISHENKLPPAAIDEVLAMFPDKEAMTVTNYIHESGGITIATMWVMDHGVIIQNVNEYADKRAPVSFLNMLLTEAVPPGAIKKIIEFLKDKKIVEGPTVDLFTTDGTGRVRIETISMPEVKWERDNYSAEVLECIDELKEVILTKDHGLGRLSILQGPPGCGKTMFIRSLVSELQEEDVTFLFAPTSVGLQLTSPNFLSVLFGHKQDNPDTKLILVLEDADMFVESRGDNSQKIAVSEFLNATDGIIGATLDLHIIATTNLKKGNFDDAITRPGRLHIIAHFDALPVEQAQKIYEREGGKGNLGRDGATGKDWTLAEIYAKAKEHDNKAKSKRKQVFGSYA